MYRIIAYNPDGSQLTIYDPVGAGALPVLAPKSAEEINEAGTVEFALIYGHPAYGLLLPKKTYISAELDGNEFFYGRVINADPSPLTGQIQYQCAGALSFLQDSEVPPDPKNSDGTYDFQTMTAEAFLSRCINAHNADVGDDERRIFTVGTVNHSRKDETRQYQISNYQDTRNVIDQNILNYYGGFLRVRRVDGNLYLDWLEDDYGDTDEGVLELGQNIISILHRMNGEDFFTSIRPVGENGITLSDSQTMDLYSDAEMAEYGKIVRTVNFPDATNESELQTKASEFISKIQKTLLISSDISLLDMKFTDEDQHGVWLGDKFTHIVGFEGTPLMVTARNRDFERPQNDSCTLKNKKAYDGTDSAEPSIKGGGTLSQRSSRNSSAGGAAFKYIHEYQDRLELNAKSIGIFGEQIEIHADQLIETANEFVRISHREGAVDTRLNIIEGTGVFQNSEHITSLAGRFHYDPETKAVELLDGSEFKIHQQDGAMITVGTRLTELGQDTSTFKGSALWTQRDNITGVCGEFDVMMIDGKRTLVIKSGGGIKIRRDNTEFGLYDEGNLTGGIMVNKLNDGSVTTKIRGDHIDISTNDGYAQLVADKNGLQTTVAQQQNTITQHGVTISSMTGSALWTQRNVITGVVGEFDIVDVNGVKTLVIKSGGGIKIRRNNTEFGLYDEGSLTGGIMVNKLNDGSVTTKIRGDHIDISTNDGYTQLVADKNGLQATVAEQQNTITQHGVTISSMTGSALWAQRNAITGVVGEFDVVTSGGKRTLVIKSGGGIKIRRNNTEFGLYDEGNLTGGIMVSKLNDGSVTTKIRGDHIDISTNDGYTQLVADKNGLQATVRDHTSTISSHTTLINGVKSRVDTIEGSALWTQRNSITGVVGEFDVVTSGGTKTLRIKSGGGLKILRNNVEYGVYDNGSLTAGVIVNKINGGTTKIDGKNVIITGTTTIKDCFTVDGYGIHALKKFYGTSSEFSSSPVVPGINFTGYGGTTFNMPASTVATMIKTASKNSNNTLTLTRFDGTTLTFSSATTLSGAWSGQTYTVTASPQNSKISVTISSVVTMQQGECYAYATWTSPSSTTPSSISGTSKKLTIVNSGDNAVKLQSAGSDVGLTFTHNKYTTGYSAGNTAGYSSAHVTGSWSGQVFTYSKTTSGTSNSSSITISSAVAMQQGECYAYATWTSPSSTTPSSISGTSKKLTIVNSGDNAVKLQSAGSDVGLTFTHNKYTSGYNSGYETGWKAGWNAYYYDTADWISNWGSGTKKEVYIPRAQGTGSGQYDYYNSSHGRGKGDGSDATCVKWFAYETGGGGSSGPTNHTGFLITVTQNEGGSKTVTASVTYPASSSIPTGLNKSGQSIQLYWY